MLIFFKPWRTFADLHSTKESWVDAFSQFLLSVDVRTQTLMDNMQQLHKCKDSKDDHFLKRRKKFASVDLFNCTHGSTVDVDSIYQGIDDGELIANLEHIEKMQSINNHNERVEWNETERILTTCGIFDKQDQCLTGNVFNTGALQDHEDVCVDNLDDRLETIWKKTYEKRWETAKSQLVTVQDTKTDKQRSNLTK